MNDHKAEKVRRFIDVLKKVQPANGHDIGLIVIGEENLSDLQSSLENSNDASVYELTKDTAASEVIKQILQDLKSSRVVFIHLHEYLDPSLYNQLYLIFQSGRVDYFLPEGSITFDIPKEAALILVSTSEDLEQLNYKNILEICGPVLRLNEE